MQLDIDVFDFLFFTICFVHLIVATIQDLRQRLISNYIILSLLISGAIINVFYFTFSDDRSDLFVTTFINIAIAFFLGLLLFYGGSWGGGDSKMLMGLSLSTNFNLFVEQENLTLFEEVFPSILVIFINQLFLIMILPVAFLLWNLYHKFVAKVNWFEGIKESSSSLKLATLVSSLHLPISAALKWNNIQFAEEYTESSAYSSEEALYKSQQTSPQSPLHANKRENKELEQTVSKVESPIIKTSFPKKEVWKLVSSGLFKVEEDETTEEELNLAEQKKEMALHLQKFPEKKHIWIRPLPPGVPFMFGGFLLYIFNINLVFILLNFAFP